jgi:ABC-type transport system involved in multi-copper enzyme maturation permease subunit
MSPVWILAKNTFREAVRDRLLTTILLVGAALVASSVILAPLTLGEEDRIIRDLGLTAVSVFSMLLVVFVGTGLVYREIEQRTIYAILTQPLTRTQFLLGKFLGLYATVLASVGLLGLLYFGIVGVFASGAAGSLVAAIGLVALEGAVVTAVAVLFSTVASPFLSAVFTFLVYLAGHLAADLELLARHAEEPGLSLATRVMSLALPALHAFHVRDNVLAGVPVPPERLAWCVLAAILYTGAALATASLAFARRDFE